VGPSQYLPRQKLDQHNCDQKERKISIVTPHGAANASKHVAAAIAVTTLQLTAKLVRCRRGARGNVVNAGRIMTHFGCRLPIYF
jgi:hypothetical protein